MMVSNKINSESKIYLTGIIITVIALFIITAVIFLFMISNKVDIVMTQSASITYTYFIKIADRILAVLLIFAILPITIYQLLSKNKTNTDKTISLIATFLLVIFTSIFFYGEYYFMKKYSTGELNTSKMFSTPSIETKIFDKIIK